jgi:ribonuclease HI
MIVAYIDGGARGNPGPAGYGVRLEQPDGTLIEEFHASIGTTTNNVAEYRALIAALEWVNSHGYREVHVRSDSLLLVQQMQGNYKVKNPGLQPLYAKARLLAVEIGRVTFEHIGRALNAHADRLANEAMDEATARPKPPARAGGGATVSPQPLAPTPVQSAVGSSRSPVPTSPVLSPQADPLTPLERAVRRFVYDHFVKTTQAPDVGTIAAAVKRTPDAVTAALKRLAELRALVLAPATVNIWMAHPFSAVPTAYPVAIAGRTYFANCAWDAAGVLSLVGGDGECRTRCADCGQEIAMTVRGGHVHDDGVVHYAVPPKRFWENIAYT